MKPKIDGPALKWLGAEFRKLIPPVPTNDEFVNLCKLLDAASGWTDGAKAA